MSIWPGLEKQREPESPRREWYDSKQGMWVSREGYEVCQDHCGPRATCPFKHDGRRRN